MGDCVFCDLIENGQLGARFFSVGDVCRVFRLAPLNPVTPGHMLFLPDRHVAFAEDEPRVTGDVFRGAAMYASQFGGDFNLIASSGKLATQTITHLHVHFVPRREGDGLRLPWSA